MQSVVDSLPCRHAIHAANNPKWFYCMGFPHSQSQRLFGRNRKKISRGQRKEEERIKFSNSEIAFLFWDFEREKIAHLYYYSRRVTSRHSSLLMVPNLRPLLREVSCCRKTRNLPDKNRKTRKKNQTLTILPIYSHFLNNEKE